MSIERITRGPIQHYIHLDLIMLIDVSFDARGPAGYDIYIVGGAKTDRDWSGRVDKLSYGSHGQFVSAQVSDMCSH